MTWLRMKIFAGAFLAVTSVLVICAPAKANNVKDAQKILSKLGFYKDNIDGKWGSNTREALNEFQKRAGFRATKRLTAGFMDVLQTIDKGGVRDFVPIAERIGNTLVVSSGERIYFDPDGTKIIQLKNGKRYKRSWRKMDNGLYCETLHNRQEFCEGITKSKYVIYKINGETRWYRLNGRREWMMKLEKGNQLKR